MKQAGTYNEGEIIVNRETSFLLKKLSLAEMVSDFPHSTGILPKKRNAPLNA